MALNYAKEYWIDANVRICFITAGGINIEALRRYILH
jgi:hypothetical protein